MKQQRGSALVVALAILGIIGVIVAIGVVSYISAFNAGNQMEKALEATRENNKNVLAQYSQKVLEASQVPDMARDDLVKVAREAMEGRYGADGSKAVFQMITEQNPTVDPQIYRQIQQIIEGGRTEFQNAQTRMIDQKRVYETELGSFWRGMWLRIAGYPKLNLAEFKAITTDRTERTFETGREEAPLQLRQQKP